MGSDATIEIQKRSVGSTMIYTCGGSLVYVRCQVPGIQFGSMICVAGFHWGVYFRMPGSDLGPHGTWV